jgi:hypothetical protein
MMRSVLVLLLPAVCVLSLCFDLRAEPWGATLFYGQLTETHFEEIPFTRPRVEERYLIAGTLRRELISLREILGWAPGRLFLDAEGGLVHKWGHWKKVDHRFQEAILSANLRYDFGKNPVGLESISFGNGFSYAAEKPEYEKQITLNERTSRLLYYMMVETAFGVPSVPDWEVLFRVHHRSGGYGTINGVNGGSNYLCLGVRYNFAWF